MEEVIDLVSHSQQVLNANGRLSEVIPGFSPRTAQIEMAKAVASAIEDRTILVVEAGTGTGKTFAYLTPCLLSGKKILISTATKTLQDQLFHSDLPTLVRALGSSVRMQNLKGRANYICRYRVQMHVEEGRLVNPQCANDILQVHKKLPLLVNGERGELPEISEDSSAWPYVTSTVDNCLGTECEFHSSCFLIKARRRAMEADIVVINHHLFFADSRLKEEGFGELLPGVDVVVFDEAHQLEEIATHFHGERLSTRQLRDLMDDTLREWPILDLPNQPLQKLSLLLDQAIDHLILSITPLEERISWQLLCMQKNVSDAWRELLTLTGEWLQCFASQIMESDSGLARCKIRLESILTFFNSYPQKKNDYILWVERFKQTVVFNATPFYISDTFNALMSKTNSSYIFTSATLTMSSSFDCFNKSLGLTNATLLMLPSPFNFKTQALLYLPRNLPDPKDHTYYERLLAQALPIIEAFGGRCFFLFTSHRALRIIAKLIAHKINFPLLIQGDEAKPILLARFRQMGNAVLLGTATFWEGVDVKGDALSCVIIDKLPFASPQDPVIRGKMEHLKSKGLSGFDELTLPAAVLALKQGVGRLIRDTSDRGVLMIADPRLTSRSYGQLIFTSLPAMQKTRDEATVLAFIRELQPNEIISN